MPITTQAFRVALSYPGEQRKFVEKIAKRLAAVLPREQIFYDRWYEAELVVPNLDILLQGIYRRQSELVVVFLCQEYEQKQWCKLEWRAVRDLIKNLKAQSIMLVRLDDADIEGLLSTDGYVDAKDRKPEAVADLILTRLNAPLPPPTNPHYLGWGLGLVVGLGILLGVWWLYVQPLINRHLSEAQGYLSSGRYSEAAGEYRQAIRLMPFSRDARLRWDIAELGQDMIAEHPDVGQLYPRLDALLAQAPDNPHLLVLDGLRLYHQGDIKGAEQRYLKAFGLDSNLAEAYFNLGVMQKDPDQAEIWFQKATDSAHGSSVAYLDARASVDLERGRYPEAIARYAAIPEYPLAKLEEAKAHWAQGDLALAEARQRKVLDWLNDDTLNAKPWNQYPWDFDVDGRTVSLRSVECKRYYTALSLAATQQMQKHITELPNAGHCQASRHFPRYPK